MLFREQTYFEEEEKHFVDKSRDDGSQAKRTVTAGLTFRTPDFTKL
jgi:hypothetical protein